jgi:hypothetical protein
MQKAILILNPVSACRFTTMNRAKRFVKKRRAEWVAPGISIRFIETSSNHRAAQRSADRTRLGYDCAAAEGKAKIQQLANLPMVAPAMFLQLGKRKGASRHTFLAAQGF